MTAERRLARVEASLSPTELVLRWLDEAHGHDSFVAYSRAICALGPGALPLDRLVREARDAAEASARHRPRDERDETIRAAIRGTVFRFHLIMQTIVLAEGALDREALMCTALSAHLGLVMVGDGDAGHSIFPSRAEGLTALRGGVLARASELRALETARARVEARYLGGHPALFPATARSWTEQRERTDALADITVRLAELEGLPSLPPDDPEAFETRVSEVVADQVEPARVKALDEIGEGHRAVSIAMAWLQPKLG